MVKFIFRRALTLIPVLWVIVTLVFFMMRLAPGGPFDEERPLPPEAIARMREHYNLDASLWRQYLEYMGELLRGNLGPSLKKRDYTVNELVALKLPVSVELGLYALIYAVVLGLTAGVLASSRPNSWRDHLPMSFAMIGICVPNIVLGPLLVLVFAIWLGWLPASGWGEPASRVLPVVTLGTAYTAYIARLARGGMLEVMSQDFIRTARAKGLGEAAVVVRHALRGGIQPVATFLGPAAAGLLTGSFVVENVFDIPGLGTEFVSSAQNRDYTMVLGTVLVYASLILLFNLAVDVVQAWLDPRVRPGK